MLLRFTRSLCVCGMKGRLSPGMKITCNWTKQTINVTQWLFMMSFCFAEWQNWMSKLNCPLLIATYQWDIKLEWRQHCNKTALELISGHGKQLAWKWLFVNHVHAAVGFSKDNKRVNKKTKRCFREMTWQQPCNNLWLVSAKHLSFSYFCALC